MGDFGPVNSKGTKVDRGKVATTMHLFRIITCLEEIGESNRKSIGKFTGVLHWEYINSALLFLVNNKILLKRKSNTEMLLFKINPRWKKL